MKKTLITILILSLIFISACSLKQNPDQITGKIILPRFNIAKCYDSDNGINLEEKGTIYSGRFFIPEKQTDFCKNNLITEFFCARNKINSITKECPKETTCKNGACIKNEILACNDKIKNYNEKDIDCNGICKPCDNSIDLIAAYFGDHYTEEQIKTIININKELFLQAINNSINLNITFSKKIPLPTEDISHNYTQTSQQYQIEYQRAKRIWWYYQGNINNEVVPKLENIENYDAILILTDAKLKEATAQQSIYKKKHRVILQSVIGEGGWLLPGKGSTFFMSETFIANIFAHELGRYMGLELSCAKFFPNNCDQCAYPEDVMSQCRQRERPPFFGFCTLNHIKNTYIKNHPGGSHYSTDPSATFFSCNDLNKESKCYKKACKNTCTRDHTFHYGGKCNLTTGFCEYKKIKNSEICKKKCSAVSSRTNLDTENTLFTTDGYKPWIALEINPENNILESIGYQKSGVELDPNKTYTISTYLWNEKPIIKEIETNNYLIPYQFKKFTFHHLFNSTSLSAQFAITNKNSVQEYQNLEYYIAC